MTWSLVPLAHLLVRSEDAVEIVPTESYSEITVRLWGKGVVQRGEVQGQEIGATRRFRVQAGQFILSRIDARNGALGIVPATLDGAVVSNDFPTYNVVQNRLLTPFLGWLSKTRKFVDLCQAASEGTTNRVRLKEDRFLATPIPLPPLSEQRRLVVRIEELAAKIDEARGLRIRTTEKSHFIIPSETTRLFNGLGAYPSKRLGELGEGGSNPIQTGPFGAQLHSSEFVPEGIPVLNVGNVDPNGLILSPLDHVLPEKAAQLSRYSLEHDDLLFARSGATLGKVCLVPDACNGWLMTGHLFRVRFNKSVCQPSFAFIALRGAQSVRDQVFAQVRGATRPGFNTTLLSNVTLPLPPVPEQRRIVAYLDDLQAKVDSLNALQAQSAAELDALLPSILDKAFKGEL